MHSIRMLALLFALTLLPLTVMAENSTTAGGYTIHHNAFTTSTLTPQVAKAYNIQRSKFRGMLNVSVIKDSEGAEVESVPASVKVKTRVLTGQGTELPMREIKEQNAVYYVGEFPIQDKEKINFVIEATPEGTTESFLINMEQEFFTD